MPTITPATSQMADELGNPLISTAYAHQADASVAHALNTVFSDTEAEAALNALGAKINVIFLILEQHGLMKAS